MRDGNFKEIRTIDEIASGWDQVAIALNVENYTIQNLTRNHPMCAQACTNMFMKWVDSPHHDHVTWERLVVALCRADFKDLAERIRLVKLNGIQS